MPVKIATLVSWTEILSGEISQRNYALQADWSWIGTGGKSHFQLR
jgi:hypothetical protein